MMSPFLENRKILYVDDESDLLSSFFSLIRKERFNTITLADSANIHKVLQEQGPFALVLSDQRMPSLDGVEVLKAVRRISPDSIRVLVTGYADQNDTIRAINIGGIHSYVAKPWNDAELRHMVQEWVAQYNLKRQNSWLTESLNEENRKLTELMDGTVAQTVRVLGDMVSHSAPAVAALASRVRKLGEAFIQTTPEIQGEEKWEIQRALELFHLGIALLPPTVQVNIGGSGIGALRKSTVTRNHHLLAAGLLKDIPRFAPVARVIRLQEKDFDGTGDPPDEAVKGQAIPLGARLLHILIDLVSQDSSSVKGADFLRHMAEQPQKYDVSIIKRMLGESQMQLPSSQERNLSITSLRNGMVLLEDIITLEGRLLLRANFTLTETAINILLQWQKNEPIKEPIRVRDS